MSLSHTFNCLMRLKRDLRAEGVRVVLPSRDLPDGIAGRFRYPDHENDPTELRIDIRDEGWRGMLLTLAHEAGHYRAWRAGEEHGEEAAQRYGLAELRRVGFEPAPGEWEWWHDDSLPVPDGWEAVPTGEEAAR